jgi:hypothetical protein
MYAYVSGEQPVMAKRNSNGSDKGEQGVLATAAQALGEAAAAVTSTLASLVGGGEGAAAQPALDPARPGETAAPADTAPAKRRTKAPARKSAAKRSAAKSAKAGARKSASKTVKAAARGKSTAKKAAKNTKKKRRA